MRAYVSVHNVQSELFCPHDVSGLTDTGRGLQTKYQTKEWDHTYIMFPQLEVYRTFLFFLLPVVIALISCALLFCLYLSQYRPKKFTPVLLSEILLGLARPRMWSQGGCGCVSAWCTHFRGIWGIIRIAAMLPEVASSATHVSSSQV